MMYDRNHYDQAGNGYPIQIVSRRVAKEKASLCMRDMNY